MADEKSVDAKPASASKKKKSVDPDDRLAPAIAAMDRGDLVEAKRLANELVADDAVDADTKSRAKNLLEQLAPDRVTVAVMVASGVLAIVLYVVYHR